MLQDNAQDLSYYANDTSWIFTRFLTHNAPWSGTIALRLINSTLTCDESLVQVLTESAAAKVTSKTGTSTCFSIEDSGMSYRGEVSTSISGTPCLAWTDNKLAFNWHKASFWLNRYVLCRYFH